MRQYLEIFTMKLIVIFVLLFLCFRPSVPNALQKLIPKPQIIKVTNDVKVAVGFGFANMILIEGLFEHFFFFTFSTNLSFFLGNDGLIVVDTLSYPSRARVAYKHLREKSKKKLKAIILTHFHPGINFCV